MSTRVHKILFSAVEQAELVTEEADVAPLGPNEVAGKTLVSLVSAGTELNLYLGNYERSGLKWGQLPFSPGYAAVFEVQETGEEVQDLRKGDLAFCMGKHRSHQRMQREAVLPVPKGLAAEQAVFARMMNVTMTTLTTTAARPPERVIVSGLGIVGYLGAKIFDACGYDVTACDPIDVRREMAQQNGLRHVLPHIPVDDPEIMGKVALVLECSGHEQAALDGCRVVQKGGEVVQVGVPMVRKTEIYAQEILNLIFRNSVTVRGGSEWQVPRYPTDFRHNSNMGNMAAGLRWMAEGRLQVGNVYEKVCPQDAQQVYQNVLHKRGDKLVYLFDWTSSLPSL